MFQGVTEALPGYLKDSPAVSERFRGVLMASGRSRSVLRGSQFQKIQVRSKDYQAF